MFGKPNIHIHEHESHTTHNKTVHEHRAPTDDSIRIYKDLQEKAQASVLEHIALDTNELKVQWTLSKNPATYRTEAICGISLNGKDHFFNIQLDEWKMGDDLSGKYIINTLRSELSKQLTSVLLDPLFKDNEVMRRLIRNQ